MPAAVAAAAGAALDCAVRFTGSGKRYDVSVFAARMNSAIAAEDRRRAHVHEMTARRRDHEADSRRAIVVGSVTETK